MARILLEIVYPFLVTGFVSEWSAAEGTRDNSTKASFVYR